MATVYDELSPPTAQKKPTPPQLLEGLPLPELTDARIRECLNEASGWLTEARTSINYYQSDQYRRSARRGDQERVRLVANVVRRRVDIMAAEILDSEPVVNPTGRTPKHFELGRLLLEVLKWTRDEEDNWESDRERAITDCLHIGEGVIYEGWNQDADDGWGRPIAKWVDSRYLFWDRLAQDPQREDADFVIWMEYEKLSHLEDRFPQYKGRLQPETFETFMMPQQQVFLRRALSAGTYRPTVARQGSTDLQRSWVKRMWYKKWAFESYYYWKANGQPATVPDEQGKERPMTDEDYDGLTTMKGEVERYRRPKAELWESVTINQHLIGHRLSPFDRDNGGHGRYPFGFFSCHRVPDESHHRGEIGFMLQSQDILNETVTMFLNQMFLSTVGYLHSYKGSLSFEEKEKLGKIGSNPIQVIETFQGIPPPEFRGTNPTGMQAAVNALPVIKDILDQITGQYDPSRGEVPGNIESGRAIRALQARSSLLTILITKHIESGLRRCTLLRLHNIMQFLRGPRELMIADPDAERGEKVLVIGSDELEIVAYHQLVPEVAPDGKVTMRMPSGKEAEMLVLNGEVAQEVVFERLKLTLDTGREKSAIERQEQAEMVLDKVGPAAIPWAARLLNWPDQEMLINDIQKNDSKEQLWAQLEGYAKQGKVDVADIIEMVGPLIQQQILQISGQVPPQGGSPGMPPGMGPASGMPQGMPPSAPGMPPPAPGPMPLGMRAAPGVMR